MATTVFAKIIDLNQTKYDKEKHKCYVYKSATKKINIVTKINTENDKVIINRIISWYDSKIERYRKRTECQVYFCDDILKENEDITTYKNKLMFCDEE